MMGKITVVIVTVVLVLLTSLWFYGRRTIGHGPHFEGVGPEDSEERVPEPPPFEIQTVSQFLAAAQSGNMPGGVKSTLPLPSAEWSCLVSPYKLWAPEPYSKLPGPQSDFGPMGDESPAPIIRIMHTAGSWNQILTMSPGANTLERSAVLLKHKIWFGIAPVSEARWQARDLDNPTNIEEAIEAIMEVVVIFDYLKEPEAQGKMRSTHNKLWTEIDIFSDAVKALYESRGEPAPEFSLTRLWEEFMRSHLKFMEAQARAWVFRRLKVLYTCWKENFMATFQSGRTLNDTQMTIKIDHWALMVLNELLDIYLEADLSLHVRVDGLITKSASMDPRFAAVITHPDNKINRLYTKVENERTKACERLVKNAIGLRGKQRRATNPVPAFMEPVYVTFDREFAHADMQPEVKEPISLEVESWVQNLTEKLESNGGQMDNFGFVIYRASYSETNDEWITFLAKLETGLSSGWEGVLGSEKIKSKATLHWIKDERIPEGNIGAIRRHFNTFTESSNFNAANLAKSVCLAITPECVKSFTDASPDVKADYRGFVIALDATFDPDLKSSTPEYDGSIKIIDQLVWTDLYGLYVNQLLCQRLEEFWGVGREHPFGVYVGPTTGVWRRNTRRIVEEALRATGASPESGEVEI